MSRFVTVDDFDEESDPCNITSPRSLEACEATGIVPEELIKRGFDYFREQAKLARGIEGQEHFIRKRSEHFEQKRLKKLQVVRQQRQELIKHERERAEAEKEDLNAVLEMERRNLEKMKERQKKELQILLAYELKRQQVEEQNRKNMEIARQREEKQREEQLQRMKEWEVHQRRTLEEKMQKQLEEEEEARRTADRITRENSQKEQELQEKEEQAKRELAARNARRMEQRRLKRIAVERKNLAMQRALIKRREEMEKQEEERLQKLEDQRIQAATEARAELERKKEKFEATQLNNQRLLEEKREAFVAKERFAEERMFEFELARAKEQEENRRRAQEKTEHLKRVKEKSDELIQLEIERALEKEEAVNERLAQREREQEEQRRVQKQLDRMKAEERKDAIQRALMMEMERANQIEQKRAVSDERTQQAMREMQERIMLKQAQDKLLQEDRKEHALRMKRIQEYETRKLTQRIESDSQRVAQMKAEQEQNAEMRRRMRDQGTQQRALIMEKFDVIKNSINLEDISGAAEGAYEIDLRQYGIDVDMKLTINLSALNAKEGVPRFEKEEKPEKPKKEKKKKDSPKATSEGNASPNTQQQESTAAKSTPRDKDKAEEQQAEEQAKKEKQLRKENKRKKKEKQQREKQQREEQERQEQEEQKRNQNFDEYQSSEESDDTEAVKLDRTRARPTSQPRQMASSASTQQLPSAARRGVPNQRSPMMSTSRSTDNLRRDKQQNLAKTYNSGAPFAKTKRIPQQQRHKQKKQEPTQQLRRPRPIINQADAEQIIENLAAEQNGYLLMLLERERANEAERERIYEAATEDKRKTLDHIFGLERAKASQIIKQISREHEESLAIKMQELGLARGASV